MAFKDIDDNSIYFNESGQTTLKKYKLSISITCWNTKSYYMLKALIDLIYEMLK